MKKIHRVKDILESEFTDEKTTICIRDHAFRLMVAGKKIDSLVLFYQYCPVENFTWQDNNYIYVDLKEN